MAAKKRKTAKSAAKNSPKGRLSNALIRGALWLVIVAVAAGILSAMGIGLYTVFFKNNPHFTIHRITIEASPAISTENVRAVLHEMGVREHQTNLLTVDPGHLRERLEKHVMVDKASVIRRLPDTLVVSLYQRRPVATLRCNPMRLIDDDGAILPWWQTADAPLLPEITGVRNPHLLRPGETVEDEVVNGALQLLRKIKTRPEGVSYDVAIIQLDYYLPSLRVHLRARKPFRGGAIVVVPVNGMDAALDRLRDVVELRRKADETISFLDVTYKRNLPMRP